MERYVSDPSVVERRLALVWAGVVGGVLATFLVVPRALVFVGPFALVVVAVATIVMLATRENPVTLDLGAYGFAIRRKRMESYEWSNVEAAWMDADCLSFRVEGLDHKLGLRRFPPSVRERILGDFRAKTRFRGAGTP
jgi:hypothetical protein